jgi:hydrogenase maturation factor
MIVTDEMLLQGLMRGYIVNTLFMCIQLPGKVQTIEGAYVIMEDGRKVRLGPLKGVKIGDYLEVYADIALGKIDPSAMKAKTYHKRRSMV